MYIKVRVFPNSKKELINKKKENSFEIFVKEKAERNLANKKVVEIIAKTFEIKTNQVRIVSGHQHHNKILSLEV